MIFFLLGFSSPLSFSTLFSPDSAHSSLVAFSSEKWGILIDMSFCIHFKCFKQVFYTQPFSLIILTFHLGNIIHTQDFKYLLPKCRCCSSIKFKPILYFEIHKISFLYIPKMSQIQQA